jgi:DNA-directed RNA polymerase specialized sigma subunit
MLMWRPLLRTQQPAINNFRRVEGLAQREIAAVFGVTPFAVSRATARQHKRLATGKTR